MANETPPVIGANFVQVGTSQFYEEVTTGFLWQYKGNAFGWNRVARFSDLTDKVFTGRTLTINGTALDLSTNRSFSVGTVTSIGLSVPTGLSFTGSTITTSGNLGLALTAGYSIPLISKQTQWDTTYLPFSGGTLTGIVTTPYINISRETTAGRGIQWYNTTYNAWVMYMAPPSVAGQGPKGNITSAAGTVVTSWAQRSFIENNTGFGWIFESGVHSGTTPTIMAEISSVNGAAKFGGTVTAPTFVGALTGNASTATSATTAGTTDKWQLNTTGLQAANFGSFGGIIQDSTTGPVNGNWYNKIKILHNNAGGYFTELAMSFTGARGVFHRRNDNGIISAWATFLDSDNYNSYSPTLTGAGASGTWGISVTGNAATSTNTRYLPNRADATSYPIIWGADQGGSNSPLFSCTGVTIQSSTGQITANQFNGVLNGNASTASNSTQWNGHTYLGTDVAVNSFLMGYGADSQWHPITVSNIRTFLGLGSAAYVNAISTIGLTTGYANLIPRFDGSGYLNTWYINSSTVNSEGGATQFIGTNGSDNYYRKQSVAQVQTALGLGSNAYTSTDYYRFETFGSDANTLPENRSSFSYQINTPFTGSLIHFGGSGYGTQINTNYGNSGNNFAFRTRNGDTNTWNPWYTVWHNGNFNPSNYIPNNGAGDWVIASNGTGTTYTTATLELRERGFGSTTAFEAPRLAFHWGGVAASQIAIESNGTLAIINNPGTAYENLKAKIVNGTESVQAPTISVSSNAGIRMDSGGVFSTDWFRSAGSSGWFNATHGGGIYMIDATYVRTYGTKQFYVDNTITSTADIVAYSDERVKTNINTIENALNKVLLLRGVTYNRTDGDDKSQKVGVIAQEVQEILPEVVHEQADGMLGVSYGNFAGLFIEAFKEQKSQYELLKTEISKLKSAVIRLGGTL